MSRFGAIVRNFERQPLTLSAERIASLCEPQALSRRERGLVLRRSSDGPFKGVAKEPDGRDGKD